MLFRGGDRSAAPRVKRGHCAAVMLQGQRWQRGFVDHDLDVVRYLRNQKIRGHSFEYLLGLRIGELRAELEERAFDVRPSTNPYRGCVRCSRRSPEAAAWGRDRALLRAVERLIDDRGCGIRTSGTFR